MVKDARDIIEKGSMEDLLDYLRHTPKYVHKKKSENFFYFENFYWFLGRHAIRTEVLLEEAMKIPTLEIMNKIFTPEELKLYLEQGRLQELSQDYHQHHQLDQDHQEADQHDSEAKSNSLSRSARADQPEEEDHESSKKSGKSSQRQSEKRQKVFTRAFTNDVHKNPKKDGQVKLGKKEFYGKEEIHEEGFRKVQFSSSLSASQDLQHHSAPTSPREKNWDETSSPRSPEKEKKIPISGSVASTDSEQDLVEDLISPRGKSRPPVSADIFKGMPKLDAFTN